MTDELIFILKVVGSGVGFWLGFSTYKWLKENVLDPIKEFKPELKKTMAEIQEMKKDFEILSNLKQDGKSPIINQIIETHDTVQKMAYIQEAKFELEQQAYFECNSNGHLVKANNAFYRLTKLSKEEALSHKWVGIISDAFQQNFLDQWERLMTNGIPINEEVPSKNGGRFLINVRKKPSDSKEVKVIIGSISTP
jgi:PAS domain S-box-containing protein